MSLTDYLLNGVLVALVVLQIRGRRLGVRTLLLPLAIVGFAAVDYVHGIPSGTGNLLLVAVGVLAGLVLGAGCGLATAVYLRTDGVAMAKAGALAAVLWIAGVGARLAFELYVSHGGQPAIDRFSVAHHITSANAWIDCLVLMALVEVVSRTAVIALRYAKLQRTSEPRSTGRRAIIGLRDQWS